jgi:hypothetical protein
VEIPIHHEFLVEVRSDELFALIADLPRYVEIEPRLVSARWLTDGPLDAGAVAEIATDIPFSLTTMRRIFGVTSGLVTLMEWDPPRAMSARLESHAVVVRASVQLAESTGGSIASLQGVLVPLQRSMAVVIRPLRPLLVMLIRRSLERGLRRAERGLKERRSIDTSV